MLCHNIFLITTETEIILITLRIFASILEYINIAESSYVHFYNINEHKVQNFNLSPYVLYLHGDDIFVKAQSFTEHSPKQLIEIQISFEFDIRSNMYQFTS